MVVLIEQGVDNFQDISINQGKYHLPETYILHYTMAKVYNIILIFLVTQYKDNWSELHINHRMR